MQLLLTDDQQLLRESAERFVAESYGFERRRAIVAGEPGMSEEVWRELAERGWLGMTLPEAHGGLGLSQADRLVLLEALGRGMLIEPLLPSAVLAAELVAACAGERHRGELLPGLAAGTLRAAVAHLEPHSRHNPAHVATRAEKSGGGYVLSGTKRAVLGAPWAHVLVVAARTGGAERDAQGISLFAVPRETSGVHLRAFETIDGSRAAELVLERVRVGAEALLGQAGGALAPLERAFDLAAAAACAEALGVIRAANQLTAEYLRTRRQFGQPIGAFQALQHRIADMSIAEQRVAALVAMLRMRLDDERAEVRQRAVSAAKAQAGLCGRFVGQQAVQLHGGIGVSEEYIVGHYFKRLAALEACFGDTHWHLERFARLSG